MEAVLTEAWITGSAVTPTTIAIPAIHSGVNDHLKIELNQRSNTSIAYLTPIVQKNEIIPIPNKSTPKLRKYIPNKTQSTKY
jgi:hypothetical protein